MNGKVVPISGSVYEKNEHLFILLGQDVWFKSSDRYLMYSLKMNTINSVASCWIRQGNRSKSKLFKYDYFNLLWDGSNTIDNP